MDEAHRDATSEPAATSPPMMMAITVLFGGPILAGWHFRRTLDAAVRATQSGAPNQAAILGSVAAEIIFLATLPAAIGAVLSLWPGSALVSYLAKWLLVLGALLTTTASGIAWFILSR